MRQAVKARGKVQKILVAAATVAVTLAGSITTGVGPAHADTGNGQVTNVYMNLGDAGPSQQSQYGQLISSLRAAAGHNYRGNVSEAQGYRGGLIRLQLTAREGSGTASPILWITPQDLYVVGFTQNNGATWVFNDVDQTTVSQIDAATQGSVAHLSFGGNYNSLRQAAGRGRESMPISWQDVWGSVWNLANPSFQNNQAIARSLSMMIQYTSEAARFNDVYGVMSDVMHASTSFYNGLPLQQQYLENNWAALSRFGYDISQNPTTQPRWFDGIGTLFSWSDVARYLALMLASYNLPGHSGDWNQSEL